YGICFLGTLAYIISYNGMIRPVFNPNIIKQISRLGVYTQMANIAQFLNYRLTYFFIKSFWLSPGQSTAPLGVYGAMNKLVDGNWLISKSLSLVQYSVLSNREEETYAQKLTLAFVKFSLIITALITAALIVLPGSFYQWLLGGESFSQIPRLILIFSPGILAMSVNNILAHYFAAKGLQKINAMVSLLGLVITVVAGLLLIPAYGLPGAAYTSSIAHTASTIMIIALFLSRTKLHLSAFLISKSDITLAKNLVWSFRKNK
ncbi:MAG: polysaccharide biosynthesis C-terminal domain-containing protein, partial [Bacteroidales bacterium]